MSMTRREFEDEVTTWWELQDFCEEIRCNIMDGLIDGDSRSAYIDEELVDLARNNTWTDLLSILQRYEDESGYEYYLYDEYYGEYRGISDYDFDDYKQQVMEWADQNDAWEPEEEEEPVDPSVFTEDNAVPVPEEDCSFDEMFEDAMVA